MNQDSICGRTDVFWAKLSKERSQWLPLSVHMSDTMDVSYHLWDEWVSAATRRYLTDNIPCGGDASKIRGLVAFLSGAHDLGKASPAFQSKIDKIGSQEISERISDAGFTWKKIRDPVPHALISMLILRNNGIDDSVSIVLGSHHGMPPSEDMLSERFRLGYANHFGFKDEAWSGAQNSLFLEAVSRSQTDLDWLKGLRIDVGCQDILIGLVIMADWIASNSDCFPLIPIGSTEVPDPDHRGREGWDALRFPTHEGLVYGRDMTFHESFGFDPRAFQELALEEVGKMERPGLVVIEAPMGEGKTEAALAIAESFANRFGFNGLFFGLPTQATANGVFSRVLRWMRACSGDGVRTLNLAHGKARFDDDFRSLPEYGWNGEDSTVVHEWFGGKKALLSDVVVGTVDQVLMAGLKRKHLSLRHLGLSEKVVIVDECHAYDEYMGSYLRKALQWLGELDVPVVLMSATLPPRIRKNMVSAYLGRDCGEVEDRGYPQITCASDDGITVSSCGGSGRDLDVSIKRIESEAVASVLAELLSEGGYAGVIVNTVKRAQHLYDEVSAALPDADVRLLHSAYTAVDRSRHEADLMRMMSTRDGRNPVVVIGTQVLEQSLDIDFDVLITDLCPIDLLIQRIGRLHRHSNVRPDKLVAAQCYVIDTGISELDPGSKAVYGAYQLLNSRILLKDLIRIPADIPGMVGRAYSDSGVDVPEDMVDAYSAAMNDMESKMDRKERKAKNFQICSPKKGSLVGWLDNQRKGQEDCYAEATVRDTDGSVEAILLQCSDGRMTLPGEGTEIPADSAPDQELAMAIANSRIQVPHFLISMFGVEKIIDDLSARSKSRIPSCWYESGWLSGELFVLMDDSGGIEIKGFKARYDRDRGLMLDE